MSTYVAMSLSMTIPPGNYAAVIERYGSYLERDTDNELEMDQGQTAVDILTALLGGAEFSAPQPVLDSDGIHIEHEFGITELGGTEADDMETLVDYALPGGEATIRYEENDHEFKRFKHEDGEVRSHEPILVYDSLPHTISDKEAELLTAALAARKEAS